MILYAVLMEWAFQGDSGFEIRKNKVFSNRDEALKLFNETIKGELANSWIDMHTGGDLILEEDKDSFCAYIDGCYSLLHTNVSLKELKGE